MKCTIDFQLKSILVIRNKQKFLKKQKMKNENLENRLKKLSKKLGYSFLAMAFVDFLFLKLFGESPEKYHTFGWYVFVIWTILCGLVFVAFVSIWIFKSLHLYFNKKEEEETKKDN